MAGVSRSTILGVTLVVAFSIAFCAILATTVRRSKLLHCPKCGDVLKEGEVRYGPNVTTYTCRECFHHFNAPPEQGFSWLDAVEEFYFRAPAIN